MFLLLGYLCGVVMVGFIAWATTDPYVAKKTWGDLGYIALLAVGWPLVLVFIAWNVLWFQVKDLFK